MTTGPFPMSLLVADRRHPGRLVIAANRPWYPPLTRLLGCSLDRRLASGCAPESGRLLAWRAAWLTSPLTRLELARSWERVWARAHRRPTPRSPRVPVCGDQTNAAEAEIRELLHTLTPPLPAAVRGLAAASWLLADGTGPLYNPRSSIDLRTALGQVIDELDPWTEVQYST